MSEQQARPNEGLQRRGLMSRHIRNPDALRSLDERQRRSLLGVGYRLFGLYPLYLAMRLLGMKRRYWRVHRRLYMALHHGENPPWPRWVVRAVLNQALEHRRGG